MDGLNLTDQNNCEEGANSEAADILVPSNQKEHSIHDSDPF